MPPNQLHRKWAAILTNSHKRINKLMYIFINITDRVGAGALVYCYTYNVIRPVSCRHR